MERQTMVWSGQSREQAQPRAGVGVLKAQLERALTMTAAASPGSCPRPWGCLCIARRSCFWGCGRPAPCPKLWGGVRNVQGVRLPWTGEGDEAAVASAELSLPRFFFFLQESIPAPFTRGVSLFLQHPDLSQRFSQQSGRLLSSTQDPALGCPVYGLACLLPRIRVCRYVPSLPFRCLPYGRRSQLCAFFSILRHYMELFLAVLVVKE